MKWKDLSLKERKQIYDSVRVNNPDATYFDIKEQFDSIPEYEDGGIHIKKKNRGKFTAAAKRAGMGVQAYAKKVLKDPNASPTLKKRANFARNFGGRKKK